MYRHVAKAFVSRASANPSRYPGGPSPDLVDRLGSAYPLDGMTALDTLAAWLPGTAEDSGPEPPPEIGLDQAVTSFLEDFEEFNRKLDAAVARALARPRPAEPIATPETPEKPKVQDAVPARPDEPRRADPQPAPAAPAIAEKPHRPADVVKISAAAPHLRWDEPDDETPHLERIKRAVALARREAQARAAQQAASAAQPAAPTARPEPPAEPPQVAPAEARAEPQQPPQPAIEPPRAAPVEVRIERPPQPAVEPAAAPQPEPEPDLADALPAEPARGGSGSSIAALVGLASLLAGGVALWLAVARQSELQQLEAALADQPGPVTAAAQAQDNIEALQALAARMDRLRERIAALETSTTDEGRDPAQAAALAARLAELEAAMQALKSLPAAKPAETAASIVAPPAATKAAATPAQTVHPKPQEPAAVAPPPAAPKQTSIPAPAPKQASPTPVKPAVSSPEQPVPSVWPPRASRDSGVPASPIAAAAPQPTPKTVPHSLVPPANPASPLRDLGPPPLLIDPSLPDEKFERKTVSAVDSGLASPSKPRKEPPAPYRAEFTQKYIAAKAGAFDGEFQQAKINADVPGTDFSVKGRFASRERLIDPFRDPEQPPWEDPERTRMHDLRVDGAVAGMGYGLRTYASGDRFEALPGDKQNLKRGRAGTEFWTSTPAGPFTIEPRVRQTYDNLQRDPTRSRMINNEFGVSVGQVVNDWPTVGYKVSYFTGDRSSAYEPAGTGSQSAGLSSYDGSVYVSGEKFDASVYAQRRLVTDSDRSGDLDSVLNYYYASATFRPTYETGITATAGITDENYTGYDARTRGRDVYLDAYYVPTGSRLSYTTYAGHSDARNDDWYQDYAYRYVGADVKWLIGKQGNEATSLSLGVLYDQYVDRFYEASNESELAVWLRLRHDFDLTGRRVHALSGPSP